MMRVKTVAILLLALVCVAAFSFAERPPGQPAGDRRQGGDGPKGNGRRPDRWRNEVISDDLRKEVEEFWKTNAPNRWEAYEKLEDEKKKKDIFGFMVGYYRGMGWLRHDTELFDARKLQIQIEDRIFAAQKKHEEAGGEESDDPQAVKARQELEQAAGALVQARISEKKLRIDRLGKQVEKEKKELSDDEAQSKKTAQDMAERLIKGMPPFGPPGGRGPDRRGERPERGGREKPEKKDEKRD
jgi:hypothetical protein